MELLHKGKSGTEQALKDELWVMEKIGQFLPDGTPLYILLVQAMQKVKPGCFAYLALDEIDEATLDGMFEPFGGKVVSDETRMIVLDKTVCAYARTALPLISPPHPTVHVAVLRMDFVKVEIDDFPREMFLLEKRDKPLTFFLKGEEIRP